MTMQCKDALALVPAYLDGEVSEAQAAPLRQHLLSCRACRNAAQADKNLKRWFAYPDQGACRVPNGFAARVARRAFAGDTGERFDAAASSGQQRSLLRFVVHLCAAAAVLMLVAALAIRSQELPRGDELRADDRVAPPVEEILDALEELNARDSAESSVREEPGE